MPEWTVYWNGGEAILTVNVTEEGIICDVFQGDDVVATWAKTAQELTEDLEGLENL